MALCYATGNLIVEPVTCSTSPVACGVSPDDCVPFVQNGDEFQVESTMPIERTSLDSALAAAFDFYAIDMDYKVEIVEKDYFKSFGKFPNDDDYFSREARLCFWEN